MTSQDENKPGQSWTVLDIERDVTYSLPIFLGVGGTILLFICCLSCGVHKLFRRETPAISAINEVYSACNRDQGSEEGWVDSIPSLDYRVAVSNHMFRDESCVPPPCLNCILIEMGEMACYQDRCPQCGRVPPDRSAAKTTNKRQYFKKNREQAKFDPMVFSDYDQV